MVHMVMMSSMDYLKKTIIKLNYSNSFLKGIEIPIFLIEQNEHNVGFVYENNGDFRIGQI